MTTEQEKFVALEPENENDKSIMVMCRIRRMNDSEKSEPDHKDRSYTQLSEQILMIGNDDERAENFKFKKVFGEESLQVDLFEPI